MDPFIEGQEWEDFHTGFIAELAAALTPRIRPRYLVRKERRIYVEHPDEERGRTIRGDVAVLGDDRSNHGQLSDRSAVATITPVAVDLPMPEEQREAFLTIRERETMRVVTMVEVFSPANKRMGSDGRREYLDKREEILASRTSLVELDLLRDGERMPTSSPLPRGDYLALVRRGRRRYRADVFAWSLRQPIPPVPIPLAGNDPDVVIDLQAVFNMTYDRAGYDYSLDYNRPVTPALNEADAGWVDETLRAAKLRP
jgi:hypothetical protein